MVMKSPTFTSPSRSLSGSCTPSTTASIAMVISVASAGFAQKDVAQKQAAIIDTIMVFIVLPFQKVWLYYDAKQRSPLLDLFIVPHPSTKSSKIFHNLVFNAARLPWPLLPQVQTRPLWFGFDPTNGGLSRRPVREPIAPWQPGLWFCRSLS